MLSLGWGSENNGSYLEVEATISGFPSVSKLHHKNICLWVGWSYNAQCWDILPAGMFPSQFGENDFLVQTHSIEFNSLSHMFAKSLMDPKTACFICLLSIMHQRKDFTRKHFTSSQGCSEKNILLILVWKKAQLFLCSDPKKACFKILYDDNSEWN